MEPESDDPGEQTADIRVDLEQHLEIRNQPSCQPVEGKYPQTPVYKQ